jgi:hypothetical protein
MFNLHRTTPLKNNHFSKYALRGLWVSVLTLLVLSACKDDSREMGLDLLPKDDFFTAHSNTDHQFVATTISQESVRSDDAGSGILGTIKDIRFGTSKADFLTQFTPDSLKRLNLSGNPDCLLDSLELNLSYAFNDWYGDDLAKHHIKVYRLTESISSDQAYQSNMPLEGYYNPSNPIGELITDAKNNMTDSAWTANSKQTKWRIKLSQEMAETFFALSNEQLADRKLFNDAFNGIYVTSEWVNPSESWRTGSLVFVNLYSSSIKLYYRQIRRDTNKAIKDTIKLNRTYNVSKELARINRFEHDDLGLIPFNNPASKKIYIQGMAGPVAKLNINESIKDWKDSLENKTGKPQFGISSITFSLAVDTTDAQYQVFTPPSQLSVYVKKGDKLEIPQFVALADKIYNPKNKTNGFLTAEFNNDPNNPRYYFSINTEFFERIMKADGDADKLDFDITELYIKPLNPDNNPTRVILKSPNDPDNPLKLNIKYVKY